jgi:type IV pilus assembly protein PilY1
MLHAFNAGFFDSATSTFEVGTSIPTYSAAVPALGEELWAYIPYNLLPHLRWLKRADYEHVYYVDQKPRVIDAQIFTADADHPDGWGTVLICGMRFGGGPIDVTEAEVNYDFNGDTDKGDTKTFTSSYFAFDITNPEVPPTLLWEFTAPGLGFTTSYPAIVHSNHLNSDWWLAFGSGPTNYTGTSTQVGKTFVLHLKTGGEFPINNSPVGTNWGVNSVMADPISVDVDIQNSQCAGGVCTYSPDVFYIGDSLGTMWRVSCTGNNWAGTQTPLVNIPADPVSGNPRPISAAASASQDDDGRLWLYFGTGQFYHENDKANEDTQVLVGVKEPIDWFDWDSDSDDEELTIYHNGCMSAQTVPIGNLLDVTGYRVFEGGYVDEEPDGVIDRTFVELVTDMKQTTADPDVPKHYDGFILDMYAPGGGAPSERCVSKPTILGGITTFTTFLPNDSACAFEGESFLYALFYKTGTSYSEPIIGYGANVITVGADTHQETARRKSLGNGVAATPSLHVGEQEGVKAFVQSSTGEIEIINEINLPEAFRSKPLFWLQTDD